ncbi:hypothetical protein TIFTF001_016987 [Ficus carica]|uniref:Uncharacterized protein n=1 Tax=Ficus carica TaxID=3494 RepID=A0AA88D7V1_FICCA|nr:hypothetical protein TIFTF001_016987 [Ficus carica]
MGARNLALEEWDFNDACAAAKRATDHRHRKQHNLSILQGGASVTILLESHRNLGGASDLSRRRLSSLARDSGDLWYSGSSENLHDPAGSRISVLTEKHDAAAAAARASQQKPTLPKNQTTTLSDMMKFASAWFEFEENKNSSWVILEDRFITCGKNDQEDLVKHFNVVKFENMEDQICPTAHSGPTTSVAEAMDLTRVATNGKCVINFFKHHPLSDSRIHPKHYPFGPLLRGVTYESVGTPNGQAQALLQGTSHTVRLSSLSRLLHHSPPP